MALSFEDDRQVLDAVCAECGDSFVAAGSFVANDGVTHALVNAQRHAQGQSSGNSVAR